jgi:hypothetical protein
VIILQKISFFRIFYVKNSITSFFLLCEMQPFSLNIKYIL